MAIPFLGVGLFMGALLTQNIMTAQRASAWPVVEARILDVRLSEGHGKGGTTYEAQARYEYVWQGRRYVSARVGIESGRDNIGRTQLNRLSLLKEHLAANIPMPCRVNPDHPSEAFLFPRIRIELALFFAGFAIVFFGAGLGLMIVSVRQGSERKSTNSLLLAHPGQPWMARKAWRSSSILFEEGKKRWTLLGMAVFWNVFSLAVLFLFLQEQKGFVWGVGLVVMVLFVLIGVFLAGQAFLQHSRYRRFGPVRFDLDPFPGHIGGAVGGNIRVLKEMDSSLTPEIHLKCYRLRVTGSGKHRRLVRDVMWSGQAERTAIWSQGRDGAVIPVRFQVPGDLPSSSGERLGDGDIIWEILLRVKTQGPDLVATFDIPVFNL